MNNEQNHGTGGSRARQRWSAGQVITGADLNFGGPYNVETAAPEFSAELTAGPTGWKSIPAFVRFAVWLWAIGTALLGTVGVGVALALYIAYVISQTNG